jgi:hypothetical protein
MMILFGASSRILLIKLLLTISCRPYGVHYQVEDNVILVFGFFHMRKNPQNWFDRFKKNS